MGWLIIGVFAFIAMVTHGDPLILLVTGALIYYALKHQQLKKGIDALEYWKSREYELKMLQTEAKESEKDRRTLVREERAVRRRKVVRQSKEMRLVDKLFKPEDRGMLNVLPLEERLKIYKMYGLKPEVVEVWRTYQEAEKRKLGLDDEDDMG